MAKRKSLTDALQEASGKPLPVSPEPTTPTVTNAPSVPPSRVGKKAITGYFDPAVSRQLKQLALDEEKHVQDLLGEALNDLFVKYGRPPIA